MASFEHMVVYLNFEIVWSYRIALLSSKRVCVTDPLVHLGYPIVFKKIVGITAIIEGLLLIVLFIFLIFSFDRQLYYPQRRHVDI